jgi:hypothetical protein
MGKLAVLMPWIAVINIIGRSDLKCQVQTFKAFVNICISRSPNKRFNIGVINYLPWHLQWQRKDNHMASDDSKETQRRSNQGSESGDSDSQL